MEPVRWGILSTARINDLVLTGARGAEGVEVVAVASRGAERAGSYARERSIPGARESYEALLEDPGVEAVYIPLPNSLHVEWTLRALEAGKHVLCEKPLSRDPREVERVFDTAEQRGLLVMEGLMYRHHPQTACLRELIDEGAIGDLRWIRARFSFLLDDASDVRLSGELDGGSLMDMGCYCVSSARLLAGEPVRASGEQVVGQAGVDIRFSGTLRFPGDVIAEFTSAFDMPWGHELEVAGTEGSLLVPDPWLCTEGMIELRRPDVAETIRPPVATETLRTPATDSYRLELDGLSAAIRGEGELLLDRSDALGQARAIKTLYAAADAGAAVEVTAA